MSNCACGLNKPYADCCEPYISGAKQAPTAEALMRSRYTAYTLSEVDYIMKTTHPKTAHEIDEQHIREWSSKSEWQSLTVVSTEAGGEEDTKGRVEFIARYKNNGENHAHHENSEFEKKDGKWYFLDGQLISAQPIRNEDKKVGRNDPCPCGSGKKFKKCCG